MPNSLAAVIDRLLTFAEQHRGNPLDPSSFLTAEQSDELTTLDTLLYAYSQLHRVSLAVLPERDDDVWMFFGNSKLPYNSCTAHLPIKAEPGEPAADGKEARGFFKFYQDLWDEKELGPKPVADPLALLARNADGTPMASKQYSIGQMWEYTACLNNPHWRAVLKAWAKRGIERGVDGYMINYFYRHNCLCEHCQSGFRTYLHERFTPEQLQQRFAIAELKTHPFKEIVGWHDPKTSTPLRREMLRFSQISCKRAFSEGDRPASISGVIKPAPSRSCT